MRLFWVQKDAFVMRKPVLRSHQPILKGGLMAETVICGRLLVNPLMFLMCVF